MSEYDYRPLKDLIHDSKKGGVQDLGKNWRVHQFAASGLVVFPADRGTGKTTLMNLCCEAVQEGTPFVGAFKTQQAKALLIQGDEPEKFSERNFDVIYLDEPFSFEQLLETIQSKEYFITATADHVLC